MIILLYKKSKISRVGNKKGKQMGIFKFFKMNMMKTKKDVNKLIELLKHGKGSSIRSNVARNLGKIGDKKAVIPLIETLDEEYFSFKEVPNYKILNEAVHALRKIGDTRAIHVLNKVIKENKDSMVQLICGEVLAEIKKKKSRK